MSQLTLYLIIGAFLTGVVSGGTIVYKFFVAGEVTQAHAETKKARKGEVDLITDTQLINKDIQNARDSCIGAPIPPAIAKRLR